MKPKQLLIGSLIIACLNAFGCSTITTIGDKALGYGPPTGISSAAMIGGAVLADGIIYLWDHSEDLVGPPTPETNTNTITDEQ